jgi:hypothetical protein
VWLAPAAHLSDSQPSITMGAAHHHSHGDIIIIIVTTATAAC